MARLRAEADYMPPRQLRQVLDRAWGAGWQARFRRFEVRPLAAASIGQVHRAVGADGRALAIKVQYPGVRRSIDSDVDNVAGLIRMSGLLPPGMDLAPLLDEAKRQLHAEADYLREAESLARFGALVADAPEFDVPAPVPELTTASVLAMDFAPGVPLESLAQAPQGERDRIVAALLELLLREMFEFGCMQTDPNFANYRYQPQTGRIVLLDFGALRDFDPAVMEAYRALLRAGLAGDRAALVEAALALGFFAEDTAPHHSAAVIDMMRLAFDAFRDEGAFDFGASDLVLRLRDRGMEIGMDRSFTHIPPMDVLYLQRKIGGLFLLGRTLGARVEVGAMAARWL
jgi:predicted unusual protein kinase regulating ubiquinone biosynthesis (AarF/ABC1/UbiB family)